jgi:hypothetical protein
MTGVNRQVETTKNGDEKWLCSFRGLSKPFKTDYLFGAGEQQPYLYEQ